MTAPLRIGWVVCSLFLILVAHQGKAGELPAGFVYLSDVDASIVEDMRYGTHNNFVGKPLAGYGSPACVLVEQAARALASVQGELAKQGLTLVVFDCYRPARAVRDMVDFATGNNFSDPEYFPNLTAQQLVPKGYIAARSGHSAGATVDLTIGRAKPGRVKLLDMGTGFDFFDPKSHSNAASVSQRAAQNRRFLIAVMARAGFSNYPKEWWHFRYRNEPYRGRSFDFPIEKRP